jgi:hypothetical protein
MIRDGPTIAERAWGRKLGMLRAVAGVAEELPGFIPQVLRQDYVSLLGVQAEGITGAYNQPLPHRRVSGTCDHRRVAPLAHSGVTAANPLSARRDEAVVVPIVASASVLGVRCAVQHIYVLRDQLGYSLGVPAC